MSSSSSNVRNLNESRAQALQALQAVSEKLGGILGGEAADLPGDGTQRNESGELVNEDGLPIIDITEPIDELDTPSLSAATEEDEVIEEDNYPEPISKLSPEALAISRGHRDKILDLLEQEESREENRSHRERQLELERKRDEARNEMQKRMVTQSTDLEKRRRAKEIEKKMAKALVSGLVTPELVLPVSQPQGEKKKTVTFADPPSPIDTKTPPNAKQQRIDWGDVVAGRLPVRQYHTSTSQTQPMKKEVVERTPTSQASAEAIPPPLLKRPESPRPLGDSDDESGSDDATSDSTLSLELGDEDVVLSAQRHRELALEYHRRREVLASNADASDLQDSPLVHNHGNGTAPDWDQEEVPLEATLAYPPPKPHGSKFKTDILNRMNVPIATSCIRPNRGPPSPNGTDLPPSARFGTSVLPPDALAKSIKMGKLVDGQLVAGQEDDDETEREAREEEEIRKLLLKSMEDYSGIAAQVMSPAAAGSYWAKPEADEAASSSTTQPAVKQKPKVSRFKVNRTQRRTSPTHSRSITPISNVRRSSPKPMSSDCDSPAAAVPSMTLSDYIIDSPSFPPLSTASNSSVTPTVLDSPSFMPPNSSDIEPSSFQRSVSLSQAVSARKPPTVIPTPSDRRAGRQSSVMATDVRERSGDRNVPASEASPQRISRFRAERSNF